MYIHGSFVNKRGDMVTVYIVTEQDRTTEVEIGSEEAGLFFTDDPCEVESEVNDTFDVLLRQSATIRLLSRNYIQDFFCASCRDAVVNIYRGETCVFAGFIEPQSFSQPFNKLYDELELNCIDALSALQYSKYRNIGAAGVLYETVKAAATQRTFYDILMEMLNGVTSDIDIVGGGSRSYLYDRSKAKDASSAGGAGIFEAFAIQEQLFLGDEEDDVWQQDKVAEEMLKFLNLHIVQDGLTFYLFDWATVKKGVGVWKDLVTGAVVSTTGRTVAIGSDNVADCGTQISVGEIYNQLLLTCEIEEVENVVESPLDSDSLRPLYNYRQLYCTEFWSNGHRAGELEGIFHMCHEMSTDRQDAFNQKWLIRVKSSSLWKFPWGLGDDLAVDFAEDGKPQEGVPNWLRQHICASLISMGSVKNCPGVRDDNSLTASVSMTDYLVVGVNGSGDDDEETCYPQPSDIRSSIPVAEYTGNSAGGNFSPADETTTNYIVISGSIVLNPLAPMSFNYSDVMKYSADNPGLYDFESDYYGKTVKNRDGGDKYYTRKYWKEGEVWDESRTDGLIPFNSDEAVQDLKFKYSAIGDGDDHVSKVAVLACMLIIGDKCVVESGTAGQTTDFEWVDYKPLEECADEDEYYAQSFTIGFDPKIGDYLIGNKYDIQNNVSYEMGIDVEGTAIPIKHGDKVHGQVKFIILGPVNTLWDEVTRRHPTFFRHTKWSSSVKPLLAHVSNILVEDFNVKVYSDGGLIDKDQGNDVVYMSDTVESYVNKKDDLTMKINSALTAEECGKLGVAANVNMSTPVDTTSGDGVLAIYDNTQDVTTKAEQLYVDAYYNEYHTPHIVMEQNFEDVDGIGRFVLYTHPALASRKFFAQGVSRNLGEGTVKIDLKEI